MSSVLVKKKGSVGYLILNRPDVLNVLDYSMSLDLKSATSKLKDDGSIKCVIVKGSGKHFTAGGDLEYFKQLVDRQVVEGESAYSKDIFDNIHVAIRDIISMEKPVIASTQGVVVGFGLSLMLACDLVVAADDCVFSAGYCKIGATPDGGMTSFLPRVVGLKKAMELVLTGDKFSSQQAQSWGMLNYVVVNVEVDSFAETLALKLCDGPNKALSRSKRLLRQTFDASLNQQLDNEIKSFMACMLEKDFTEGVTAFTERRNAKFSE